MNKEEYYKLCKNKIKKNKQSYWMNYDYSNLQYIFSTYDPRHIKGRISDAVIMLDTETSKSHKDTYHYDGRKMVVDDNINYIVFWSLAIYAFDSIICVLCGRKPSEIPKCIELISKNLKSDHFVVYQHNLAYDYVFERSFFFRSFGYPQKTLNVKRHKPIFIDWGFFQLRDSLILAQRSLEKWGNDLDIPHKKLVGEWDYDKLRNQNTPISKSELNYGLFDVIAGVECIAKMLELEGDSIATIPYTSTSYIRRKVEREGKRHNYHNVFIKNAPTYEDYLFLLQAFAGGYVHNNRYRHGIILYDVECQDISSSYPTRLICDKFPCSKFIKVSRETSIKEIFDNMNDYAYLIDVTFYAIELKDTQVMPYISESKTVEKLNVLLDNGKVLRACNLRMKITEQDLYIIDKVYNYKAYKINDLRFAYKDYLPRWYTDLIFSLYKDKCKLKGVDQVRYDISKTYINGAYGDTVKRVVMDDIIEDYTTGEYEEISKLDEEEYNKAIKSEKKMLPFSVGVWVTAYSRRELFEIAEKCINHFEAWAYSDTDSLYSDDWNYEAIEDYNNHMIKRVADRGYSGVVVGDNIYHLGILECDGKYKEFKSLGAKKYAKKSYNDEISITVAGVPKKNGAKCLKSLDEFEVGKIFDGETTGKLLHSYLYQNEIKIDDRGNEYADSINLSKCDYTLNDSYIDAFEFVWNFLDGNIIIIESEDDYTID